MNLKLLLISLLCLMSVGTHAQQSKQNSLNIGDPSPPIQVRWIKGTPVKQFEKDKVYVMEFWATWCLPCIAGMPHLSELAKQYKGKVSIAGISVMERKATTQARIDKFVDSMGSKMDYNVGAEDSNFMAVNWLRAAGERGIPIAYIIDQKEKIAWIGHPKELDEVLPQVVNRNWSIEKALARRNENKRIAKLDGEVIPILNPFMGRPGKPDSALIVIESILKKEPGLKYAPRLGHFAFYSLIKIDPEKAYKYGKELISAKTYSDPPYKTISDAVSYMTEVQKKELTKKLYELGAEAYQAQIDNYPWSMNLPDTYNKIAEWYFKANDKEKTIRAQVKAIEAAIQKPSFPPSRLTELQEQLRKYQEM